MNDSLFNEIQDSAKYLNLDLNSQEMAQFAMEHDLGEKQLQALSSVLSYLQEKKKENIISTLLKLSRLPLKEPKRYTQDIAYPVSTVCAQKSRIYWSSGSWKNSSGHGVWTGMLSKWYEGIFP